MAQAREYSAVKHVVTVHSVEAALEAIDGYVGAPEEFVLRIAQSVNAPVNLGGGRVVTGVQMALITDRVLSRNWCPKGFEDEGEFRLYFYGVL